MKQIIFTLLLFILGISSVQAQGAFSEKGPGYYWTKGGEKIEGEFKISYKSHLVGETVLKHYVNGKKVGRVDLSNLQSLILWKDSFVLGYNFTLDNWASYDADLIRVEQEGAINLYSHCRKVKQSFGNSVPISYLVCRYIVRDAKNKSYIGIANKKQFESYFIPLIESNESLKNKILAMKRRDWFDALPSFVREFNESY